MFLYRVDILAILFKWKMAVYTVFSNDQGDKINIALWNCSSQHILKSFHVSGIDRLTLTLGVEVHLVTCAENHSTIG